MEVPQMKKNVGSTDRVVRLVVGLGLLSLVWLGPQTFWGLLGIIPLATAVTSYCPNYQIIGISTCKSDEAAEPEAA
ncbi:MAG: DUF2892 domain-containing protein [Candidatus Latescibacteria bacterium]|nr:DUF2892 domain-containing protein [Candidatus Latescibacterota bacterium]